jgi:RES domain-containing protein
MNKEGHIRAWRLVKASRSATAFDGEGAFRFGGRWNSRGHRVVYTSGSLALALLEILVHLDPAGAVPEFAAFPITIPTACLHSARNAIQQDAASASPRNLALVETRGTGDRWIDTAASAALCVPSAIVPCEHNYLLNPSHPDFQRCEIGAAQAFHFDSRLYCFIK